MPPFTPPAMTLPGGAPGVGVRPPIKQEELLRVMIVVPKLITFVPVTSVPMKLP